MNSPAVAVDFDSQAEGLEDRPLQLGIGVGKLGGQVRKGGQNRARVLGVDGGAVASGLIELLENSLRFLALAFEAADALADDDRIDPCLDRGELTLDLLVDFAELACNPLPRPVAPRVQGVGRAELWAWKWSSAFGPKILVAKKLSIRWVSLSSRTYCHLPGP